METDFCGFASDLPLKSAVQLQKNPREAKITKENGSSRSDFHWKKTLRDLSNAWLLTSERDDNRKSGHQSIIIDNLTFVFFKFSSSKCIYLVEMLAKFT